MCPLLTAAHMGLVTVYADFESQIQTFYILVAILCMSVNVNTIFNLVYVVFTWPSIDLIHNTLSYLKYLIWCLSLQ